MSKHVKTYVGKIEHIPIFDQDGFYNFCPDFVFEDGKLIENSNQMEVFKEEGKINLRGGRRALCDELALDQYHVIRFADSDIEDNSYYNKRILTNIDMKSNTVEPLSNLGICRVVINDPDAGDIPEQENQLYLPALDYNDREQVLVGVYTGEGDLVYVGPLEVHMRAYDQTYFVTSSYKRAKTDKQIYTATTALDATVLPITTEDDWYIYQDQLIPQEIDSMTTGEMLKEIIHSVQPEYVKDGKIVVADVAKIIEGANTAAFGYHKITPTLLEKRKEALITHLESLQTAGEFLDQTMDIIAKIILNGKESCFEANDLVQQAIQSIVKQPELLRSIQSYQIVANKIDGLNQEKATLTQAIEQLQQEQCQMENENKQLSDSRKQELVQQYDQDIQDKTAELDKLTQSFHQKQEEYRHLLNFESTYHAAEREQSRYDTFRAQANDLKVKLDSMEKLYAEKQKQYESRIDAVLQDRAVLSRANELSAKSIQQSEENLYRKCAEQIYSRQTPPTFLDFHQQIIQPLQIIRDYTNDDIINLFACIYTGFLTVFSGEPGTGKTSICNAIATVLGCNNFDEMHSPLSDQSVNLNRYIPVSVERGWSTKRDFLGYFNPLTKTFDKNNKHLYDGLSIQSAEVVSNQEKYPLLILLDEANLSPLEYYWGDFMKIADTDNPSDILNLGNDIERHISKQLRFLATINNDHTTETLSPRLIDRAWVVQLPKGNRRQDQLHTDYNYIAPMEPVTWQAFAHLFTATSTAIYPHIQLPYDEILALLEQHHCTVSHRSKNMMEHYMQVTQNWYEENTTTALDYAVVQKIIPMISGYGMDFDAFLQTFSDLCNRHNLIRSKECLDALIKRGRASTYYFSYFN